MDWRSNVVVCACGDMAGAFTPAPLQLNPTTYRTCLCRKDVRLDWMYAGSLAAKHEAQARQDAAGAGAGGSSSAAAAAGGAAAAAAAGVPTALERQQQQQEAPLMGKQPAPDEHLSRAEQAARPSFMAAGGVPTSQNEQWARMTNDPLLAIKQQEQEALKRVKQNPIKMQQILKEVC